MTPFTRLRISTSGRRPPLRVGAMSGAISIHSASVRSLGYLRMIAIVSPRGSPPSTSAAPRFGLLPQPIHPIQGVSRRTLSQNGYELEQAELKPSPHNPAGFI